MRKAAVCVYVFLIAQQWSIAQQPGSTERADRKPLEAARVLPDHGEFRPMTQTERLQYYCKSTFGVEGLLRSAAGSGISQWQNTPSEWGQGAEGYSKRFANSYAQHVVRGTMMYGASSLLHEDNRYVPTRETAAGARLKYAIESSFLARHDDGTRHLSISRLGSYLATAFISRAWQPHSTNGAQNAVMSAGTAMSTTVGFNVAREFLPRIFRRHRG